MVGAGFRDLGYHYFNILSFLLESLPIKFPLNLFDLHLDGSLFVPKLDQVPLVNKLEWRHWLRDIRWQRALLRWVDLQRGSQLWLVC